MTMETKEPADKHQWGKKISVTRAPDYVADTSPTWATEPIIEIMLIGLTSADMPITEIYGDGWQSRIDNPEIWSYLEFCSIYYPSIRLQSKRLSIEWLDAAICAVYFAVQSAIPTTIEETKPSAIWQIIQCPIQFSVQSQFQCQIEWDISSEVKLWRILPNKFPTHTVWSPVTQQQRQLTTAIDFRINCFQIMLPTKPYQISHWRCNHFQRGGWLYLNSNPCYIQ